MKIEITYHPAEAEAASVTLRLLRTLHPDARVQRTEKTPEEIHLCMTADADHQVAVFPCDVCKHGPIIRCTKKRMSVCPATIPDEP